MTNVFKAVRVLGKSTICVAGVFWLFGLGPIQDISTQTIQHIVKGQKFLADSFGVTNYLDIPKETHQV